MWSFEGFVICMSLGTMALSLIGEFPLQLDTGKQLLSNGDLMRFTATQSWVAMTLKTQLFNFLLFLLPYDK